MKESVIVMVTDLTHFRTTKSREFLVGSFGSYSTAWDNAVAYTRMKNAEGGDKFRYYIKYK